jgi:hypothetical protein
MNAAASTCCVVCTAPKSNFVPPPLSLSWACSACTYENPPLSLSCGACVTLRPFKPDLPSGTPTLLPSRSSVDGWTCKLCTLKNGISESVCLTCASERGDERAGREAAVAALLGVHEERAREAAVIALLESEAAQAMQQAADAEARDFIVAHSLVDAELAANVSHAEQREIDEAAGREAARILREELLDSIESDCVICLSTFRVTDMFTLNCQESHRFCMECIRRQVREKGTYTRKAHFKRHICCYADHSRTRRSKPRSVCEMRLRTDLRRNR